MSVRAKFRCVEVGEQATGGTPPTMKKIRLQAVMPPWKDGRYDPDHPRSAW